MLQQEWGAVYEAFNPQKPADSAHRAERPYTPAEKILTALRSPRNKKLLFKGTSGNGKTTELLYVVEKAQDQRFVVFFDFEQHFRSTMKDDAALQSAQPWELLFLVGAALWRAGNEAGIPWLPGHRPELEEAYTALLTQDDAKPVTVDLLAVASTLTLLVGGATALTLGVAPVAMAAITPGLVRLASTGTWVKSFLIGGRGELQDQDPNVARLLRAVDALLLHIAGQHRPALLVLDGLDRLSPQASDRHFVASGLLSDLTCSMVLTAPMGVSATRSAFDVVCTLENVPVLDRSAPDTPGASCVFFREVWRLRAGRLVNALTETQLDRLAWASGGLLRHFCRLIRGVAERAEATGAPTVEDTWINAEIDERRRDLEDGMTREQFALLQTVADNPQHELPEGELARALLAEHRLVPYPNESTWYFPHPLLTLKKVRALPLSGSSAS